MNVLAIKRYNINKRQRFSGHNSTRVAAFIDRHKRLGSSNTSRKMDILEHNQKCLIQLKCHVIQMKKDRINKE